VFLSGHKKRAMVNLKEIIFGSPAWRKHRRHPGLR